MVRYAVALMLVAGVGLATSPLAAQSGCGPGECLTCWEEGDFHRAPCVDWTEVELGVTGESHNLLSWGPCEGGGPHNHTSTICFGELADAGRDLEALLAGERIVLRDEAERWVATGNGAVTWNPTRELLQLWDCARTRVLAQLPVTEVIGTEGTKIGPRVALHR